MGYVDNYMTAIGSKWLRLEFLIFFFFCLPDYNEFLPESSASTLKYNAPIVIADFLIFNEQVSIAYSIGDESPLRSITETESIALFADKLVKMLTCGATYMLRTKQA